MMGCAELSHMHAEDDKPSARCAGRGAGEKRDELASFQLTELHSIPASQGRSSTSEHYQGLACQQRANGALRALAFLAEGQNRGARGDGRSRSLPDL
jgi:hypothetical protein